MPTESIWLTTSTPKYRVCCITFATAGIRRLEPMEYDEAYMIALQLYRKTIVPKMVWLEPVIGISFENLHSHQ